MNYSAEIKEALLRRMLPPNNESVTKISGEEGISEQIFRNWRDKARAGGIAVPGKDALPDDWSTQDKFLIVVETASMNEIELAEYARKKRALRGTDQSMPPCELVPALADEDIYIGS